MGKNYFLFLMKVPQQRRSQNKTEVKENLVQCCSERTHSRNFPLIIYKKKLTLPLILRFYFRKQFISTAESAARTDAEMPS